MKIQKLLTVTLLLTLLAWSAAQGNVFEAGQTWSLYFQDAEGWRVSLERQTAEGIESSATGSSFGEPLQAMHTGLDAEDKAFLGLTGDYTAFLVSYPTQVVTIDGAEILLCALPAGDLSQGQAFGLRQTSTGPSLVYAGRNCSAELAADAGGAATKAWPPAIQVGDIWQIVVVQNGAELASWTAQFDAGQGQELTGSATGADERIAEASFFGENAPQPSFVNNWVFALSGPNLQPLYCTFSQDKPFTPESMTGSVMFMGATCLATKQ